VNVEHDIWGALTKFVVGLIVLAVLLLIGMCYLPLIQENTRMRAQILKLNQQIETETNQLNQLQAQIDALLNDPKTVERLARVKLGYAKPGETIIRFEPATNAASR
jgi:cell division protein FtsB